METAEPPEPLDSVHGWISIFHKSSLLKIVGPAARHSVSSVYSVD
jgi:hypothetical protein